MTTVFLNPTLVLHLLNVSEVSDRAIVFLLKCILHVISMILHSPRFPSAFTVMSPILFFFFSLSHLYLPWHFLMSTTLRWIFE